MTVVPAFAIVDPLVPANECKADSGGVGSDAGGKQKDPGKIAGFPVPNNNPGSENHADVEGAPEGAGSDNCGPPED